MPLLFFAVASSFLKYSFKQGEKKKMAHILANIYKLNNAIIRMTTAASVIDSYVCSALMQPPFTFQNETNEGIQQELKEIATMWSFRTRQSLSQTNKDIVSFCEIYICLYPRLVHYASRVDDKDKKKSEAAKSSFTILWEILHEEVNSRLFACGGFFDELSKFRERSETEQPILDTRVQGVISKFDEEKRLKLKKLRDQIAEKKGDMSEEMKIIVLGTISDVGGLMIAVGSLGKVKLGGVSTIVVSSGLGVAGGLYIFYLVTYFFGFFLTSLSFFFVSFCLFGFDRYIPENQRCIKRIQRKGPRISQTHERVPEIK